MSSAWFKFFFFFFEWYGAHRDLHSVDRRQRQMCIRDRSGVADSVDPMAGSYLIEHLTDEIEERARIYIEKIDALGGALRAIENGYIQNEIQDAAYAAQRRLENGEDIVVGVNKFQQDEEIVLEPLTIDPAVEIEQRRKLAELRQNRDQLKIVELQNRLEAAAKGDENLMPLFIEAVEHQMTLGEICNVLRGVWGEYRAPTFI